ncbi:MAG TPA: NAD-dependent epimerase/dehydratase family protein [Vicinamibacteria bacterium]|nr:NAD-dependent epimerase/dehydratase family protein [Vicinamibacteria bacterium]
MKVLLTGGTGFLGKNVATALDAAGHSVRILARAGSNLAGLPPAAEIAPGDVTDAGSLERAAHGCGAILHMAAVVKMWAPDPAVFDAVNLGGLRNALAAARAAGARLVYTSSFMAIGPAGPTPADESQVHPGTYRNAYERTKAQADAAAREAAAAGQDVVMLYPGVVYGPGDLTDGNLVVKMVVDHLQGRLPGIIGPGDRLWSYSYVSDVAAGQLAALARGRAGQRYFLCGENADMNGLFALLAELTGVPVPRRHIPYPLATALGGALWAWAELTGHPPQLTHQVVGVFREHWAYSSAKAERELGYRVTPLREGLQETIAWLREQGTIAGGPGC